MGDQSLRMSQHHQMSLRQPQRRVLSLDKHNICVYLFGFLAERKIESWLMVAIHVI